MTCEHCNPVSAAPSTVGVVAVAGSPRAVVQFRSGSTFKPMSFPAGMQLEQGDMVLIDWASGGTIVGRVQS